MKRWTGLCCVICFTVASRANPLRLAGAARLDLNAGPEVGALTEAYLLAGSGTIGRQDWRPAHERSRTYTVNLDAAHYTWSEFILQFTPLSNGTVTLALMGPWEQAPGGAIYRQEVFWDALSASNTTLANGSFEDVREGLPSGWTRPRGDAAVVSGPVPAREGRRYAKTWHDGPLQTMLSVTGGVPVILRGFVRAAFPSNLTEMTRISGTNTPAHRAARHFKHGVNLGNYLEAPPGQNWGASYSNADFVQMHAEGFDHVRIPVGWHHYAGPPPEYLLSTSIFAKVDALVTTAVREGLAVIVNIHHFEAFTRDPAGQSEKFVALWRQIAAHYSNAPPTVAFELLNEPKDAATTEVMNSIYAEAIAAIRCSNPDRTIFVGPGRWNAIRELGRLQLPDNDRNLIVTVHCYEPFLFTHQGASWTMPATATRGVVYPGPPPKPLSPHPAVARNAQISEWFRQYNTVPTPHNPCSARVLVSTLTLARQWSDYYGRPVHLGEFGCYVQADPDSRRRYYADCRATAEALGLGWAMWDWKAGFRYWDDATGRPAPGMREALFPAAAPSAQ